MPDPTTDPVAAYLAQVRKEFDVFGEASALPRLHAALGAVLALHVRQGKPVRNYSKMCPEHAWNPADRSIGRLEDIRDCPDCGYTEYYVCAHCECPDDKWPCPTYRAISAELLGEGGSGA